MICSNASARWHRERGVPLCAYVISRSPIMLSSHCVGDCFLPGLDIEAFKRSESVDLGIANREAAERYLWTSETWKTALSILSLKAGKSWRAGMSETASLDIRIDVAFYCTLIFRRPCLKLPPKHNCGARARLVRIVFKSNHVLFRYGLLNRRKQTRHGWPGQRNSLFMAVYKAFLAIVDFLIKALLSGVEGTPLLFKVEREQQHRGIRIYRNRPPSDGKRTSPRPFCDPCH